MAGTDRSSLTLFGAPLPSIQDIPEGENPRHFEEHFGFRFRKSKLSGMSGTLDSPGFTYQHGTAGDALYAAKVATQAPVVALDMAVPMPGALHFSPAAAFGRANAVKVGDWGPEFRIVAADGQIVTNRDFLGRMALLSFRRVHSTKFFCPSCLPLMDQLETLYGEFQRRDVQVVSIFPTTLVLAREFNEALGLTHPIYSDPDWNSFYAYDTGTFGLPMQSWFLLDKDGTVVWLWRSTSDALNQSIMSVPTPASILQRIDQIASTQQVLA